VPNAYVICYVNVTDTEAYEEYRRLAGIAADKFGLRFLARAGAPRCSRATRTPSGW
jgi:uncharacterized protein (DUF1330 family)